MAHIDLALRHIIIPPCLTFRGDRIASVVLGVGGRLDNIGINGGTYIDVGMLILPSSPV